MTNTYILDKLTEGCDSRGFLELLVCGTAPPPGPRRGVSRQRRRPGIREGFAKSATLWDAPRWNDLQTINALANVRDGKVPK